jgi:diaminopimelate decarboxylase
VHTGADLFLRTAYCPDHFSHRIELLDPDASTRSTICVTIAGPLCFSGDVLLKNKSMLEMYVSDKIVILDAGANTISLFSRHCSRVSPAVIGFRSFESDSLGRSRFRCARLRDEETVDQVLNFWD